MEITIFDASGKDVEAAAHLSVKIWEPIRDGIKRELGEELYEVFFKNWREEKRNAVKTELSSGRGYVAKDNDSVVGFISYSIDENGQTGVIGTNGVDSAYRGNGIGGKLYDFIFECMRKEGVKFVKVHTGGDDGHKPARRAYEKAGFEKLLPNVVYYKKL